MKLSQIRYFVTVCQYGNMTRAAEEFHISQPALTKAIQALEEEFGFPLFDRSGKKFRLTAEGKVFREQAEELVDHADRVIRDMRELGNCRGKIHVVTMPNIGVFVVSGPLWQFQQEHPQTPLNVVETTKNSALEALDHETADIAVLISNRISREKYQVLPFFHSQVVYCMGPEHPLAGRKSVVFQDVLPYPMILEKNDSRQPPVIAKQLARRGLTGDIFLCTQQHETAFQMVGGNIGYFVMRELAERQPQLCWADLDEPEASLEIGLVWKKKRRLDSDSGTLVQFIKERYRLPV